MTCQSYCQHGGKCILEDNHDGDHDSRYCQWTDNESIPRDQANAMARQHGPLGYLLAAFDEAFSPD